MELRLHHKNAWKALNAAPATVSATEMMMVSEPAKGAVWLHGP